MALVHYPILARDGSIVTTSITNLDIHDIARSAFTYGAIRYYLVHPVHAQRELARRVTEHWVSGSGARRIPDRKSAMEGVQIVEDLASARHDLTERARARRADEAEGQANLQSEVWVTSAAELEGAMTHHTARHALRAAGPPVLLVLGTGWGLAPEVIASADARLAPIRSPRADNYNHLSVRAAAAILLDRLLGGSVDA